MSLIVVNRWVNGVCVEFWHVHVKTDFVKFWRAIRHVLLQETTHCSCGNLGFHKNLQSFLDVSDRLNRRVNIGVSGILACSSENSFRKSFEMPFDILSSKEPTTHSWSNRNLGFHESGTSDADSARASSIITAVRCFRNQIVAADRCCRGGIGCRRSKKLYELFQGVEDSMMLRFASRTGRNYRKNRTSLLTDLYKKENNSSSNPHMQAIRPHFFAARVSETAATTTTTPGDGHNMMALWARRHQVGGQRSITGSSNAGGTTAEAASIPAAPASNIKFVVWYLRKLEQYPLRTKALTAGTIYTVSDLTSQVERIPSSGGNRSLWLFWFCLSVFLLSNLGLQLDFFFFCDSCNTGEGFGWRNLGSKLLFDQLQ